MTSYIVLLRGINVGGKNLLPMKSLAALLEGLGASEVKTYIQSGNVVLRHPEKKAQALATLITEAIARDFGFAPDTMVLTAASLQQAIANNPYPEAIESPTSLHFGFLAGVPKAPKLDKLDAMKTASERYSIVGDVFYLHAPDGIGKSKLAAGAERALGVPMTARNWNTVAKLAQMCA